MRRKDREILDPETIENVIKGCHCCRVGFYDNGQVYIVPLNFGYKKTDGRYTFYFHGAKEGRRVELAKSDPQVGFELDTDYQLHEADTPCDYSAAFQSIIGTGQLQIVEAIDEKQEGLTAIMKHNTGKSGWHFPAAMVNAVCVMKLEVETLSCKIHV